MRIDKAIASASASATAIDFQKLLREERKKARTRKKQNLSDGEDKDDTDDDNNNKNDEHDEAGLTRCESKACDKDTSKTSSNQLVLPPWTYIDSNSDTNTTTTTPHLDVRSSRCRSSSPPSLYYVPNYLHQNYQQALLEWLQALPESPYDKRQTTTFGTWTRLPHAKRRVAVFQTSSDDESSFPAPLQNIVDRLIQSQVFSAPNLPNHILINEYQADQGILPHTDGPAYLPCTATLSLVSTAVLQFTTRREQQQQQLQDTSNDNNNNNNNNNKNDDNGALQIVLHPGSLVVFQDDLYSNYLHSISGAATAATVSDESSTTTGGSDFQEMTNATCCNAPAGTVVPRGYRISLTIRHKKGL